MNVLLLPLLIACFGWVIAWGFVKIIFLPHRSISIAGIKWTSPFAKRIAQLPVQEIMSNLAPGDSFKNVLPFIDAKLDEFFKERLVQKMPIVSMFIGDKTIIQLKEVFIEELQQLFPDLVIQFTKTAQLQFLLNIEELWSRKLETYLAKATYKLRFAAFCLGFIWGLLLQLILRQL
jgi:hypothetical protein